LVVKSSGSRATGSFPCGRSSDPSDDDDCSGAVAELGDVSVQAASIRGITETERSDRNNLRVLGIIFPLLDGSDEADFGLSMLKTT